MDTTLSYNVERPTGRRDIEPPTQSALSKRWQNRFYSDSDISKSELPFVRSDYVIPPEWHERGPTTSTDAIDQDARPIQESRPYSAPSSHATRRDYPVNETSYMDMSLTAALDGELLLKAKKLFLPSSVFTGMNLDIDVIAYFCIIQEFQQNHTMKGFVNPISLVAQRTDESRPPLTLSVRPLWRSDEAPSPTADGFAYLKDQHTFIHQDINEDLWPQDSLKVLIILLYLTDEQHANAVFIEKTGATTLRVSRFDPNGIGSVWVDDLLERDIKSNESLLALLTSEAFGTGYDLKWTTYDWAFPFGLQLKCEQQQQSKGLCNLHTAQVVDFVIRNQPDGHSKALLYFEAQSPTQILLDAKAFEARVKRINQHLLRPYLAFSNYRAVVLTEFRENTALRITMEKYREAIRDAYHRQRFKDLEQIVYELERQNGDEDFVEELRAPVGKKYEGTL